MPISLKDDIYENDTENKKKMKENDTPNYYFLFYFPSVSQESDGQ